MARCTKIINPGQDDAKYVINVKQIAKFVVGLGDKVSPTDIEEGMRVGVDRTKYSIQVRFLFYSFPPSRLPTSSQRTQSHLTQIITYVPLLSSEDPPPPQN